MTKAELLELLDIDHGADFTYYENIAELLECEKEIGVDAIHGLLVEADLSIFAEIVESYFYDIMEKMPDNDIDIYNILEAVKRNFITLAESGNTVPLAEQLEEFHVYYALTDNCVVTDREKGISVKKPLRDAISDNRLAIIDNRELDFDLEEAKGFALEEYIIGVGDLYDEDYS